MSTQFSANQTIYKTNEDDLLGNGKDDTTALKAGRNPVINPDAGLATTVVAIDGDLQTIDTIAEAYTLNPAANTSGAATNKHSSNFLLRWLIQIVQNLRVQGNIGSAVTDSGNPVKIGGKYNATLPTFTDGQRGDIQLTQRGEVIFAEQDFVSSTLNISAADSGSTSSVGADSQTIYAGTPTANSTAAVSVTGQSSFAIQIDGTWVGTLQFERSLDGGLTYTAIAAFAAGTSYTRSTTAANGRWHGNCSSSNSIRVRATAWTSGTANIKILAGAGTGTITIGNPIRLFDAVSGSQATIKPVTSGQASTDTVIPVRPSISVVKVSCNTLTRPANTTLYNVNASISNSTTAPSARTFSNVVSANGGSGEIVRAVLRSSDGITGSIRLYLRNDNSAPTAVNDNTTYAYTDLQTNSVGYIDFSATTAGRISEGLLSSGSTIPFTCGGSTTSLFGQLMVVTAFTPVSGQTIDIDLWVVDRN